MSEKLLVYYFGDDEAYFKGLQKEFIKAKISATFVKLFESTEANIQSLFIQVNQHRPDCVFIDFSKYTQDYLHLARLLTRTPWDYELKLVGLLDLLSSPEVMTESIATGVDLIFIKSSETFDVIFELMKLIRPAQNATHGFATANAKDDWEAGVTCKVGYIEETGLHIETDLSLMSGQKLRLKHYWIDKKVVPSQEVLVREVFSTNLFYHFQSSANLEFFFEDEIIVSDDIEPSRLIELQTTRNENIEIHRQRLCSWIDNNVDSSLEKKEKILAVDRDFHFYQHHLRTDKLPYTVRCIPFFNDISLELKRLQPHVIAYELEELPENKNTLEDLEKLIRVIKAKYTTSPPFIVVFNCLISSKELQDKFAFPQVMAHQDVLSVDVLSKMINLISKKIHKPMIMAPRVFLKKNNTASVAEIIVPIKVFKLSETDMVFTSNVELKPGMNLHVSSPVDFRVNVMPLKADGKVPLYYGMIHGIGEVGKKALRRYINAIFFREHDAQLQQEIAEFKKLNELKLLEKAEQLKAAVAADAEPEIPEDAEKSEDFEKPVED